MPTRSLTEDYVEIISTVGNATGIEVNTCVKIVRDEVNAMLLDTTWFTFILQEPALLLLSSLQFFRGFAKN